MLKPMTIGQLSRRTGVSVKTLREYERLGFLYTLGRSESNYRLFDESALWCVQVVQAMRSLGLTLKVIRELTETYVQRPGEPFTPHMQRKLNQAFRRIDSQIADLQAMRQRILDFRSAQAAGQPSELGRLFASDPQGKHRQLPLDSPPGVRV